LTIRQSLWFLNIASNCSTALTVGGATLVDSDGDPFVSSSMGLLRDNGDFGFLLGPGEADEEGVK